MGTAAPQLRLCLIELIVFAMLRCACWKLLFGARASRNNALQVFMFTNDLGVDNAGWVVGVRVLLRRFGCESVYCVLLGCWVVMFGVALRWGGGGGRGGSLGWLGRLLATESRELAADTFFMHSHSCHCIFVLGWID